MKNFLRRKFGHADGGSAVQRAQRPTAIICAFLLFIRPKPLALASALQCTRENGLCTPTCCGFLRKWSPNLFSSRIFSFRFAFTRSSVPSVARHKTGDMFDVLVDSILGSEDAFGLANEMG